MAATSVLVLDDAEAITMLTSSSLTMYGYDVTECNFPLKALEIVKKQSFDVMLVDIMMPEMDGVTFIKNARKLPTCSKTKFVILSSKKLNKEEEKEIFDMGAAILSKPFIPKVLVEKIGEILS